MLRFLKPAVNPPFLLFPSVIYDCLIIPHEGPQTKKEEEGKKPFPFPYKCERVHLRNFFPPPTIISMRSRKAKKAPAISHNFPLFFARVSILEIPPPFPPIPQGGPYFSFFCCLPLSFLSPFLDLLPLSLFLLLRFFFLTYYLWGERVGREVQNSPAIILPPSSQCESF